MARDFNFIPKSPDNNFTDRFREIIMDPLNILINKVYNAGLINSEYVMLHNGIAVPYTGDYAYYGDFSQILILNRGVHEPLEEFIFQELLKKLPEKVSMIEMGAYWGHYSMWLKKIKPQADLTLIEADNNNLSVGKQNFQRLQMNAEFLLQKVGHKNFNLDEYLVEKSIDRLNVLHADIQGYEFEMISDSSRALSQCLIDYLMISTHSQTLHNSVLQHLLKYNYIINVSSDFDNETTSCDGFIFASSPKVEQIVENWQPLGRLDIINSTNSEICDYITLTKERFRL